MPGFEIVLYRPDRSSERYKVPDLGLVIGRAAESDIVLAYQSVSRRHARLWMDGADLCIEDLGSSNGIEVNGMRTMRGCLGDGDEVQVGEISFRVAQSADSTLGQSFITPRRAAELHQEILESTSNPRLVVLYRAARLLGEVFDLDQLLHEILTLIFDAVPANRGYVLTIAESPGDPEVRACLPRDCAGGGPPLSNTLLRHVVDRREAMLTLDAATDDRFDVSDSIVAHHIHAAMCAPLLAQDRVVGAIYVDTGAGGKPFGTGDLELLSAVAGVVGVAVDNARLYEERMQKERVAALGLATAGLGHCVKNILTGIRSGADLVNMALEKRDLALVERGWPILNRAIERVDLLVNNMLSYSKDRVPERQPVNVRKLALEIVESQSARATQLGVLLHTELAETPPFQADAQELYRALLNLVVNAIEACERRGGEVRVLYRLDDDGAHFEISDTGPGIPADLLSRLPEAFLSTKGGSGTGLGLACAYKVVREHNGRIDVENISGSGARFRVFLPHEAHTGVPTQRLTAVG